MEYQCIEGISLSEFNDKAGFQLVISLPANSPLTQEQFTLHSDLILPRQQLCQRILALEYKQEYMLISMPSLSKNKGKDKTYSRQKYIYALSVVVRKERYIKEMSAYKEMIRKIAKFFKVIEETHHLIYRNTMHLPYITSLLSNIFKDLNNSTTCNLSYICTHYCFINLNKSELPMREEDGQWGEDAVPISSLTFAEVDSIEGETAKKLMTYAFDGGYTLHRIYKLHKEEDPYKIRSIYRAALQQGLVWMLDSFSLRNLYCITDKIHSYMQGAANHQKFLQIIQHISIQTTNIDKLANQIMGLYLEFNRLRCVGKVLQSNWRLAQRIDVVKMIRLGQIHGFLRRIHQKIVFSVLPQPLLSPQPLRKHLQDFHGLAMTSKVFEEEHLKMTSQLKAALLQGQTVDEMAASLQIQGNRLLKIINEEGRQILNVNLTGKGHCKLK